MTGIEQQEEGTVQKNTQDDRWRIGPSTHGSKNVQVCASVLCVDPAECVGAVSAGCCLFQDTVTLPCRAVNQLESENLNSPKDAEPKAKHFLIGSSHLKPGPLQVCVSYCTMSQSSHDICQRLRNAAQVASCPRPAPLWSSPLQPRLVLDDTTSVAMVTRQTVARATTGCLGLAGIETVDLASELRSGPQKAELYCLSEGANLVSIHSQEESNFVKSLIKNFDPNEGYTWIGLSDLHYDGKWMWSDGSKAGYFIWSTGEPTNWQGMEHCVHTNYGPDPKDQIPSRGYT
ncbi:unnamed protein product [Menidia menidia]|uniref:(Atlantic silverside) hypothetical protein n=1 Tax=Menidia menidia TaxID=238744 RepID=A0A8S4ALI1_9TELE|nr:unnamed protein product [Menidia menidia]